jgi:cell division protein FtsN
MPNAEVDLAEMLLIGEAGPPSPKRALPLLQRAAVAGHPLAQFLLGQMYESGEAVPKNMSRATELYIEAARAGLEEAKDRLASLGSANAAAPGKSSADVRTADPEPKPQQAAAPAEPKPQQAAALAGPKPQQAAAPAGPKPQQAAALAGPKPQQAAVPAGEVKPGTSAFVQLGSFKSALIAEAQWGRFSRMPFLISSSHTVQKADLGQKGIWYRLLVDAGPEPNSAASLCEKIKASGQECLVQRGSGRQ